MFKDCRKLIFDSNAVLLKIFLSYESDPRARLSSPPGWFK